MRLAPNNSVFTRDFVSWVVHSVPFFLILGFPTVRLVFLCYAYAFGTLDPSTPTCFEGFAYSVYFLLTMSLQSFQ